MTRDKRTLYIVSAVITVALLLVLLLAGGSTRIVAAVLLTAAAVAACLLIKKRSILSLNKRTVLLLMSVIGLLYITVLYLSGLYFGFWRATVPFSVRSLFLNVLPIAVIIVASEVIRYVLVAQKHGFSSACAYIIGVAAELAIAVNFRDLADFYEFMDAVALYLFPALTANILYRYLSARYGALPNIAYRALLSLYVYFLPTFPALPEVLTALVGLALPFLIYWFLFTLFEKRHRPATASRAKGKVAIVSLVLAVLFSVLLMMLISCRFHFGAIVIATESMTGTLNKGDVIIYESHDGKPLAEGQIAVFEKYGMLMVHRVIKVEHINGETRYYTKGDANKTEDSGYITDSEIVGTTNVKLAYVGYPSLWLRALFTAKS